MGSPAISALGELYVASESGNLFAFGGMIVPVELASFDARVVENRVYLQWTTESESNNLGFEVEMKRAEEQLWQKVALVKGAGTTNEPRSYSYSEEHDRPGEIEYRLKQIDTNGDIAYSRIIKVTVNAPEGICTGAELSESVQPGHDNRLPPAQRGVRHRQFEAAGRSETKKMWVLK